MCLYWENWKVDSCFGIPFLIGESSLFLKLFVSMDAIIHMNICILRVFSVAVCYVGYCVYSNIMDALFFSSVQSCIGPLLILRQETLQGENQNTMNYYCLWIFLFIPFITWIEMPIFTRIIFWGPSNLV